MTSGSRYCSLTHFATLVEGIGHLWPIMSYAVQRNNHNFRKDFKIMFPFQSMHLDKTAPMKVEADRIDLLK